MERNISGIYIIKNTVNNKVYIGSAVCCKQRFIGHKSDFKKKQHNDRFQNFVNKYGIETLQFDIVEQVFDKNKLIEREQYWIDFYQSYKSKNGYNISKTAGSTLGCKMPKSHLDSCKKRMLGNTFSLGRKWTEPEKKEIGARSKKMWEENPEKKKNMGEKLSKQRKGVSIWENRPHPALGKVSPCKGQKRSKEFCELMSKQRFENNGMKGIKLSKERVEQIKKQVSKPLALIDDNGNILKEYKSQREATIDLGLTKGAVSRVCKGEYKQTKGYKFKYL